MNGLMRLRLVTMTFVMAVAACDRPTAPELLERIDQAESDLLSDTTAEHALRQKFAGSWDLIRLLPNASVEPNLLADIDGRQHWFKAFVFERVVVRLDTGDGYPCPLMHRELLAIEERRQVFMLKGSDFGQPIGDTDWCELNPGEGGVTHGARPFLWMERLDNSPRIVGLSGDARIDDVGTGSECSFLKIHEGFPLKVDCELRDYSVQLSTRLGVSKDDQTHGLTLSQPVMTVLHQRVPGLRLVIHCTEKQTEIGGCGLMPQ
jgi:hypothetical protein